MTQTKIAATLLLLAAIMLGGFLSSALAAQAVNFVYSGNQLIRIDFDDGSSIQFGYDGNGNLISKTPGNQFYAITSSAGTGGTISPSGSVNIINGGDYTFTITPNPGESCTSSVTVDGNSVGTPESYTFFNVTAGHTISAAFGTCSYPITVSVNGSGAVSPNSANVPYGGNQSFTISPNTGWYIGGVYVDGNPEGAVTGYTFTNVTEPHSITANFQIYTYLITTSTIGGGSISPASPMVNYGGSQTFTITPPQGITVYDVQADGVSQGSVGSYTFTNVTANHTLSANFNIIKNSRTSAYYQHLQDAYNAAQNGDTLLVQGGLFTESFTANQSISVTIDGGYTSNYSSNPGATTIKGAQTISAGTVTWKNFVISN